MKIAVIDADLISNIKKQRFPNLACMKISSYHKNLGHDVILKLDYENLQEFDKVFISKVFTETIVPDEIYFMPNVKYGGTGFFYDKAEPLEYDIEHSKPDYELYLDWANSRLKDGEKRKGLEYYFDYSIGFTTRGCIRGCGFCVNKNSKKVVNHSPVNEFLDDSKKKICLLDDNILASSDWKNIFNSLIETKKSFQYKQGMDLRLMTDEKAFILKSAKYEGDYIFAFDDINDYEIIEKKLILWKKYNKSKGQNTKFYVFCGFDREDKYNDEFWVSDIVDIFERVQLLAKYNCKPYIMRFIKYKESKYKGIYINIATWCNQPSLFFNHSYSEFCDKDNKRKGGESATKRYNDLFLQSEHGKDLWELYCKTKPSDLYTDNKL